MRPSGTPQESGFGATALAVAGLATVAVASWASAGNPANATSVASNTISRIRFFKAVLLFHSARVLPFLYFCGLDVKPAPVTNSGARPQDHGSYVCAKRMRSSSGGWL